MGFSTSSDSNALVATSIGAQSFSGSSAWVRRRKRRYYIIQMDLAGQLSPYVGAWEVSHTTFLHTIHMVPDT
jgi:hypothetical protein